MNYDLAKFIDLLPGSTISYGSELRPVNQFEPLLIHHPNYDRFKVNLMEGIDYPLEDLTRPSNFEPVVRSKPSAIIAAGRGIHLDFKSVIGSKLPAVVTAIREIHLDLKYII